MQKQSDNLDPHPAVDAANHITVDVVTLERFQNALQASIGDFGRIMARFTAPQPRTLQIELLDVSQVAMMTGVSERLIQQLASSGDEHFPRSIKVRRCTKWRRADVLKWIQSRPFSR